MSQTSEAFRRNGPPRRPTVILCDPATAGRRLAALTLLDRLIVAAHRAGCDAITIVGATPLPDHARARAWGIPFEVATAPPACPGPVLVMTTAQLVQPADLRLLFAGGGRLVASDRRPLPTGWLGEWPEGENPDFDSLPEIVVRGASAPISSDADADAAERLLWASLTSSSDGWVDRHFNRPCGRPLSRWLIHTPITPNAVSLTSIVIGLAAAACLAWGEFAFAVWGALLFQLSAVVDCVDGDVARAVFKESAFGKWLDIVGDQVVHAAIFAGVALGLARAGSDSPVGWLGLSAIAGALLAFGVVIRGLGQAAREDTRLQRLIDATTNRDFSVVVLVLAAVERLEWFLWMAAIGSHLFWLTALTLQIGAGQSRRRPA